MLSARTRPRTERRRCSSSSCCAVENVTCNGACKCLRVHHVLCAEGTLLKRAICYTLPSVLPFHCATEGSVLHIAHSSFVLLFQQYTKIIKKAVLTYLETHMRTHTHLSAQSVARGQPCLSSTLAHTHKSSNINTDTHTNMQRHTYTPECAACCERAASLLLQHVCCTDQWLCGCCAHALLSSVAALHLFLWLSFVRHPCAHISK